MAVLLLASLFLTLWATRWTTAEVLKARAISAFRSSEQSSSESYQRQHAMTLLASAKKLNPYNAEYPFYQAYFSIPVEHASSAMLEKRPINLEHAHQFYRQAITLRPHSGHIWAQYANALLESNSDIEKTVNTIEKALALAPYQLAVLQTELKIGLTYWDHLSKKQKQQLRTSTDYLLEHKPYLVINTAVAHGLAKPLRLLLKKEKDIHQLDRALVKQEKNHAN